MTVFNAIQSQNIWVVVLALGLMGCAPAQPADAPTRGATPVPIANGQQAVQMAIQGDRLAWIYTDYGANHAGPYVQGLMVYSLPEARVVYSDTTSVALLRLEPQRLSLLRVWDRQPNGPANEDGFSLDLLDLDSLNTVTVLDRVPVGLQVNGQTAFWLLSATCRPLHVCDHANEPACVTQDRRLYAYSFETGSLTELGSFPSDTYLVALSDSLVVHSQSSGGCSIKSYTGPTIAEDLTTRAFWEVAPFSMSPGIFSVVRSLSDRRVLVQVGFDRIRILDLPPEGEAQVVMDAHWGYGYTLVGERILLYAPQLSDNPSDPIGGLDAYDLATGATQHLVDADHRVIAVASDGRRVAWLTDAGELFVANLELQPGRKRALTETPIATTPPVTAQLLDIYP